MTHSLRGGQRPERNPLEFVLCFVLGFGSMPIVLRTAPLPGSLDAQPTPFGQVSAAIIVLGSLGIMAGILWRDRDHGLLIQQAALWFLGVGLTFYGVAVWHASSFDSARIAILLSFGVALGAFARIVQFQLYVRHRASTAES